VLHRYVDDAARSRPEHSAVEEPGHAALSYGELARLSDRTRDRLRALGVARGDRVGVWMTKSVDAVAAILGVLKTGAAYVPVDPTAPAARNAYILADCGVAAVAVEAAFAEPLRAELAKLDRAMPPALELPATGGGGGLRAALDAADAIAVAPAGASAEVAPQDLAYVLYTSGSTGKPKGVMLSHENAVAFVEWCAETFAPTPADRFSSHAPLHFDLSILDLYTPQRAGATLVVVPAEQGKEPVGLARLIADARITIWYSAPSILSMLAQRGRLETLDLSALRLVLFAGEVFPVVHLRALAKQVPHPRYWNLYGPTETNVCTAYEVKLPIPEDRVQPYPIGPVCSHLRGLVLDPEGREVPRGAEGELVIAGPNVMQGYWNLPEQSAKAFLERDGARWYRTGDIVVEEADGALRYVARRDRMVKRRGYRVELGEIEACLYRHPDVLEAAVVARPDAEAGVRVLAHVATREGKKLSLIAAKQFCAAHLPIYMVPDALRVHERLPKTSTDKVDYQKLQEE
jgi:amino acid adenylation domain-containing protein